MKKLLISLSTLLFFISCQNKSQNNNMATNDSTAQYAAAAFKNPISKDSATKLVSEFKENKKLKFKGIVQANFNVANMKSIFSDSTVDNVYFFVGVFPANTVGKKDDSPVIIMQIRRKSTAATPPPPEYYLGDEYCPPPNDGTCGTLEQPSFQ